MAISTVGSRLATLIRLPPDEIDPYTENEVGATSDRFERA